MKVYLLWQFETLYGVFSSEEKALVFAKEYMEDLELSYNEDDWFVSENVVDQYVTKGEDDYGC